MPDIWYPSMYSSPFFGGFHRIGCTQHTKKPWCFELQAPRQIDAPGSPRSSPFGLRPCHQNVPLVNTYIHLTRTRIASERFHPPCTYPPTHRVLSSIQMIYETIPLADTTTTTGVSTYGVHPLPVETTGAFDLPQLIGQQVTEVPSASEWKKWGRHKRSEQSQAWHFYCCDYRFESTLRNPDLLLHTGATFAVEVNVSTHEGDPMAVALAGLYRKRSVTQFWQQNGVTTAIDLNVSGIARELVFEGLPTNHNIFASKYQVKDLAGEPIGLDGLVEDYLLADSYVEADTPINFIVYGGGNKVSQFCSDHGWLWIPNANNNR